VFKQSFFFARKAGAQQFFTRSYVLDQMPELPFPISPVLQTAIITEFFGNISLLYCK
jgi:hypothetical protein